MVQILFVGLGGAIGAIARYGISTLLIRQMGNSFPFGTLAVNLIGCFLIGLSYAFIQEKDVIPDTLRLFLITGIFGGFTTFSSFGHETIILLRAEQWASASVYVASSVLIGLLAVWVGYALGRSE